MSSMNGENTRTYTNLLVEALSHLHGTGDVRLSLKGFLCDVQNLLQATDVLWWEYDGREDSVCLHGCAGEFDPSEEEITAPADRGLIGEVLKSGDSQILEGTAINEYIPAEIPLPPGVETALGVRVGTQERPLGVLVSLFPSGASLAAQQMETVELLAAAFGRALEGRHLQEELQSQFQRLLLLQDLSHILQSKHSMEVRLEKLVDTLTEAFGARFGHIILADEDGDELEFRAASGIELSELGALKVETGKGICGKVFESGTPRLVPDVSKDPDYLQGHPQVRSEMAVPIKAEGEVIGVLNLESNELGQFTQDDLRLAGIAASHAGVTLHHALAYEFAITRMRELELLNRVTRVIDTIDDLEELLDMVVNEIHSFLETTVSGILLVEENGVDMRVHASAGGEVESFSDLRLQVGKGITGAAAMTRQIQYVPDVTQDERYLPVNPSIRSELAVPLTEGAKVIGVLNLESREEDAFSPEDLRVVDIVATQISQILSKALLYEELSTMAVTDGLTNLYNHRQFFVRLEAEFKRALRYSYPLSLIMMDIDLFKNFNDTYGHLRGDDVLREIAGLVTQTMRETDVVARYGGEEFVGILPLCHESTAMEVAERLRRRVEEADLGDDKDRTTLTISLGVCTAPQYASSHEELVRRADNAMYASKNAGRNRTTLWRPGISD